MVTGLTPGTSYEYRVGNDRKRSPWMPLETPAQGSFSALIFPDSQSADYSGWKALAQKAFKDHPDVSFFVNMGDLVDNGEHAYQWDAWFDALQGVIERIPVAPLLGNHETYTLDWKVRRPLAYLQLFQLPAGDARYAGEFYSFDVGEVHFTVLNTQDSELKAWEPNLLKDEAEWLRRDLAGTKRNGKSFLCTVMCCSMDLPQDRPRGRKVFLIQDAFLCPFLTRLKWMPCLRPISIPSGTAGISRGSAVMKQGPFTF